MKKIILVLALFVCFAVVVSAQTVAFTNVNVIPMDKERILQNQVVIVSNGIITAIGKNVKVPKDAQIIDGKGKYLIPGLMDMHTHLLSDGDEYPKSIAEDELKVMIANGVTTIRLMIGTKEQLILREQSAKGEIIAPTIYAASPHLTGREQGNDFVVKTEEEARQAVRQSKATGYDFIKITTFIDAKVYEAAIDEAAKQNIRVVGHADSRFVGVERALKAKQQIEHLDGYMEMLLADNAPMKGSVSDLYIYQLKNWESLDFIDESKIAKVAKRTVESNPFVDPTQHFMKNTFGLPRSEESIRAQPDFKFYPKAVQDFFIDFHKKHRLFTIPIEKRAKWIEIRNKLIKAIYDAGGKILAGSDSPEFLFLYGFSEHRELKALNDAGLSTYATLEAATKNPSIFFGTLDKVGTIEKGKRADLVLLDANPLENISNTEKRAGVMLKGKYYPQTEMNKWLDEIAPKIANSYTEKTPNPNVATASVADRLFEAMRVKNAEAIKNLFLENGQLTALDRPKSGEGFSTIRNYSADAFAKLISESKAGEFVEKMPEKIIRIYGDAAVVNGHYTFNVGDKFSHCGTNAFHLIKVENIWRIANATSVLDTAGCNKPMDYSGEKANALATVKKLFQLMTAHKPDEIIALHTPESQLTALINTRDGKSRIENLTREAFSKFFEKKTAEIREKMYAPEVKVFGDIATVDGRYIFTVNGKIQHCGMNSFHLVRTAEGWKLGNSISTIEPNGCTEKEKALVAN